MSASVPAMRMSRAVSLAEVAQQEVAATGSELGELFQYEVTAPVTVRRGASALVPIVGSRLACRRELLFNESKLPAHPVAALRFTNTTGLVLERGPVTVLEDGAYRGEAMLPFSREGADVYLAYLVELGIRITVETSERTETAGIDLDGDAMTVKQAIVRTTRYHIDNGLPDARRITVEHASLRDAELADTPPPDAQTAELYRSERGTRWRDGSPSSPWPSGAIPGSRRRSSTTPTLRCRSTGARVGSTTRSAPGPLSPSGPLWWTTGRRSAAQ